MVAVNVAIAESNILRLVAEDRRLVVESVVVLVLEVKIVVVLGIWLVVIVTAVSIIVLDLCVLLVSEYKMF